MQRWLGAGWAAVWCLLLSWLSHHSLCLCFTQASFTVAYLSPSGSCQLLEPVGDWQGWAEEMAPSILMARKD